MHELDEKQQSEMDDIYCRLHGAESDLRSQLNSLRKRLEEEWENLVVLKIRAVNQAKAEAELFTQSIHGRLGAFYGSRSERWQESPTDESFREWMDGWDVDLPELEVEEPQIEDIDEFQLPSEALIELPVEFS